LTDFYSLNDELIDAVFLRESDEVGRLLRLGADPDALDEEGRPALLTAASDGAAELVRMLLDAGSDPNLCDRDGWSALDVALYRQRLDLIRLLVQYGGDIDQARDTGAVVLLRALPGLATTTQSQTGAADACARHDFPDLAFDRATQQRDPGPACDRARAKN
jgi:ankyrin repeat protein